MKFKSILALATVIASGVLSIHAPKTASVINLNDVRTDKATTFPGGHDKSACAWFVEAVAER